jgi:hypothetical protein
MIDINKTRVNVETSPRRAEFHEFDCRASQRIRPENQRRLDGLLLEALEIGFDIDGATNLEFWASRGRNTLILSR